MGCKHIFPQLRPMCKRLGLLQFADDVIFFNAKPKWARKINETLQQFGFESGQKVNQRKSSLHFSCNTPRDVTRKIKEIFSISNSPIMVKCLGATISCEDSLASDTQIIMSKMESKFSGWKGNLLSPAGRKVLIQSVSSTIPNYWMSFHKVRKKHIHQMHKSQARFLWTG